MPLNVEEDALRPAKAYGAQQRRDALSFAQQEPRFENTPSSIPLKLPRLECKTERRQQREKASGEPWGNDLSSGWGSAQNDEEVDKDLELLQDCASVSCRHSGE